MLVDVNLWCVYVCDFVARRPRDALRHAMSFLDQFRRVLAVFALRVPNAMVNRVVKPLREHSLKRVGLKLVFEDPTDPSKRLMLLDEAITPHNMPAVVSAVLDDQIQMVPYNVQLTAENFTLPELLRTVIPEPLDLPAAYECVGHIAHINLREEVLPYKHAIGEAILAKVKVHYAVLYARARAPVEHHLIASRLHTRSTSRRL